MTKWILYQFTLYASWLTLFAIAIQHTWKIRNIVVFDHNMPLAKKYLSHFQFDLGFSNFVFQEYEYASKDQQLTRQIYWNSLLFGYMKLDVDGAW